MKLLSHLLRAAMVMTMASCVNHSTPSKAKKPFPTEASEQEYALYYDGSGYEAPVMGWDEARRVFMTGGTPR